MSRGSKEYSTTVIFLLGQTSQTLKIKSVEVPMTYISTNTFPFSINLIFFIAFIIFVSHQGTVFVKLQERPTHQCWQLQLLYCMIICSLSVISFCYVVC